MCSGAFTPGPDDRNPVCNRAFIHCAGRGLQIRGRHYTESFHSRMRIIQKEGTNIRPVIYMYMTCGQVQACLIVLENLCASRRGFFGFDRDGTLEYVLVPEANLVPISPFPLEEAAILRHSGNLVGAVHHRPISSLPKPGGRGPGRAGLARRPMRARLRSPG